MKSFFSLGFLGFIALGTTASFAASKTLGASACQTIDESNRQIARGETDISSAYGDFSISCPILRDNLTNTNGLSALQFRVTKGDATARSCTAYSADGYGNSLKSVVRSVTGTGVQTFDWTNTLNVSSTNGAYYSVLCDLGASDFGQNLYWSETTSTSTTDTKTMPATVAKTGQLDHQLQRGAFGLWGTSPGTFGDYRVEFPVLRDTFSASKTLTSLSLRMYRGNPNYVAGCTAVVTDNYTIPYKIVGRSAGNLGNNTLSWGSMNVALLSGYYDIECTLAEDDMVYSYSWGE